MKRKIIPAPGQQSFFDTVRIAEDEYFAHCVMLQRICIGPAHLWDLMIANMMEQARQSGQAYRKPKKVKGKHTISKKGL